MVRRALTILLNMHTFPSCPYFCVCVDMQLLLNTCVAIPLLLNTCVDISLLLNTCTLKIHKRRTKDDKKDGETE